MPTIDSLFDWFLSATLRGSLLILAVLLVQIALGRHLPAGWRHALWLPVLLVLGSPILPESPMSIENGWTATRPMPVSVANASAAIGKTAFAAPGPTTPAPIDWMTVAAWIWLAGAIVVLLTGLIACLRTLATFRRSSLPASARLNEELAEASRSSGMRRVPRILLSPEVPGPAVTGLIRPLLLLPASFEEAFDGEERRLILCHECTHVKRGDLLFNGIVVLLQAVHWCNPFVWFAFKRFRADRELACDSSVLAMNRLDDRSRYGHALLKVESAMAPVSWRLGFLGLVGLFGRGRLLSTRITAIAGHRRVHPFWNLAGPALLIAIGLTGATRAQKETVVASEEQIFIDAKFIELPAKGTVEIRAKFLTTQDDEKTMVYSGDANVEEALIETPDSVVVSAPKVATLSGQRATIEVGSEVKQADERIPFVGIRLELQPTLRDEFIDLAVSATMSRLNTVPDGSAKGITEEKIETKVTVRSGEVLLFLPQPASDSGEKRLFLVIRPRVGDKAETIP